MIRGWKAGFPKDSTPDSKQKAASTAAVARPLIQIKVSAAKAWHRFVMPWKEIKSAPPDCDLELAVIDREGTHALIFACRRQGGVWISAKTHRPIDVSPTHWREWTDGASL